MSNIWAFDSIKNKYSLYRGDNCMKKFCFSLTEHASDVINFEKKKMLQLTEEELKSHQDSTVCYICKTDSHKNLLETKITEKLGIIVILQVNTEVGT